ncbi:MAG: transglycosylase SLT domain-containing protein [Myxococcales bacterium]|nr:transglycosylase SLT domain-containing protein [Myxococcales bacterium]
MQWWFGEGRGLGPLGLPVLPLAVLMACSGPTAPPAGHGVQTPIGLDAGAGPEADASEPPKPSADRFDLEQFTPLLALPSLSKARAAVERGQPGAAVKIVEKVFSEEKAGLSSEERASWEYLAGRLHEQAGSTKEATVAYQRAAAEPEWPLSNYAKLGVARSLTRLHKFDDALLWLEKVKPEAPIDDDLDLLIAEAAKGAGKVDTAIRHWTAHLESRDRPADRLNVALRLSSALLERAEARPETSVEDRLQALRWARRVRIENPRGDARRRMAEQLEAKALSALPEDKRKQQQKLSLDLELVRIRSLLDAGYDKAADEAAEAVLSEQPASVRYSEIGCEILLLKAKALASKRKHGEAADALAEPIRRCKGDDLRARLLYLAGVYASRDGRHTQAVQRFTQLEKEAPAHRLADDARMKAAYSYYELGVEKKFTELLSSMDRDYPEGDMVLDGVFRLAMRRIEKGDWPGAAQVLERAAKLGELRDGARGREYAGRERYFWARALMQLGETERGKAEYEAIVRELPLSYYMLLAYSRLNEIDAQRAAQVRDEAMESSARQPFSFERRPEFKEPGFVRALELSRVGDLANAKREISAMGIVKRGAAPAVLWGIALLYARAGSANLSHGVARGLLTDWPQRWPAGDWIQTWEIAFPRPYFPTVQRNAKLTGVSESLVYAVMREESAFDADAESPASAYGLMQLIVPTAKLYAKGLPYDARALKRPSINITLGCRALGKLSETFEQHPLLAIPGYNAGPGRPRRWLRQRPNLDFDLWVEAIPYSETRRYTQRVLASRAAYTVLYDTANSEQSLLLPLRIKN